MTHARVPAVLALAGVLAAAAPGAAQRQTWTGFISDSHCGAKPHAGEHHGKKVTDKQCILGIEGDPSYKPCLGYGATFVFVSKGTVFKVSNQDHPGLRQYAADTVRVTGELSGDTIAVATIVLAQAEKP
jgi:hypothetical protein